MDVVYDNGATRCTFRLPGHRNRVIATDKSLQFKHPTAQSPRELAATFMKFRKLAAKGALKLLPVG